MANIKAGVVLVTKFCVPEDDLFSNYINYMDRSEAARNEHMNEFNLYNDYMGNPQKSAGLFTESKDVLTEEEKKQLKNCFVKAQENGSLMWQSVISFDNRWLQKNGLYNPDTKMVDEKKLHEVTRLGISEMLKNEGMENALWSASIHHNTDNIHIHVATVEPVPMRKIKEYNGKKEYVGKFKLKSIEKGKSRIVNKIMNEQKENQLINSIIRDKLVESVKNNPLEKDKLLVQDFLKIRNMLPNDKRKWNYNSNAIISIRPYIDELSKKYINTYFSNDFQDLEEALSIQEQKYREAYGNKIGGEANYSSNKIMDLYQRLGNAILKQEKEFDRNVNKIVVKKETIISSSNEILDDSMGEHEVPSEMDYYKSMGTDYEAPSEIDYYESMGVEYSKMDYYESLEVNYLEENSTRIIKEKEKGGDERGDSNNIVTIVNKYVCKWSKELKAAKKFIYDKDKRNIKMAIDLLEEEIHKGNVLALYELGNIYNDGKGGIVDEEKAGKYYKASYHGFDYLYNDMQKSNDTKLYNDFMRSYIPYRLGKMSYSGIGTKQNYKAAAEKFKEANNEYGDYYLGKLYFSGDGVEQDYSIALKYYTSAINRALNKEKNPNPYACYEIAKMYAEGIGCSPQADVSHKYYKMAFEQFIRLNAKDPDDKLQFRIGMLYLKGQGVLIDTQKAVEYLEKAADIGNVYAQTELAKIYIKEGNDDNIKKAIVYLEEIASKNNDRAQYILGKFYLDKESKNYDITRAIKYLEASADQGNQYAAYQLGKVYLDKETSEYDKSKAIKYLEASADQGNQYAAYQLGTVYLNKETPEYDKSKAMMYLEASANQENQFAQYQLGMVYLNKENPECDKNKAMKYLEASANQKNQYAQYQLGMLYLDKEMPEYAKNKAIKYMKASADQGNEFAEYQIGKFYINIENKEYNIHKGLQYLDSSAKKGNEYAQYQLGMIYLRKDSPEYDKNKAMKYLEVSANQGNQYAEYQIGKLYLDIENKEYNVNTGVKYLESSAKKGNEYAQYTLGKYYWHNSQIPQN